MAAEPAAAAAPASKPKVVAIFVKNRVKEIDDDKVKVLEDLITSRISDSGYRVLSREDVVNSVKAFAKTGPNAGDDSLPGAQLDAALSNNTSALRLSQSMGADYLLVASITTYGQDVSTVDTGDVHAQVTESTMRVSYKILDGVSGGSLTGDVATVSVKDLEQPGSHVSHDLVNKLLDAASVKLSDALLAKAQANVLPDPGTGAKMADFSIEIAMTDLAVPEVIKSDTGEYSITANKYRIEVMAATVELDGIVVGSTPGPFSAAPGLHKLRITREGFTDFNRTISIRDGLHLNLAMQMSPDGYARWRDNVAFLQQVKDQAKTTDADVKRIEGMAKMFEQSGMRIDSRSNVDVKSDIKGDYKGDTKINGTSLWPEYKPARDGRDGRDGKDGLLGPEGKPGRDGRDGVNGSNGANGANGTVLTPIVTPVHSNFVNGLPTTNPTGR